MKPFILISILIVYCFNSFGQMPGSFPDDFGNVPANFSTGAPSLSIPIWTASSGSLSLPVSLQYSTNGIRKIDETSIVGAGWQLSAGGFIAQLIRGIDGVNPKIPEKSKITNEYLDSVSKGMIDTEPDLFVYRFGAYSGQFFFDKDSNIQFTVQNNLKIKRTRVLFSGPSLQYVFTITDGNGINYLFYNVRTSKEYWQRDGKITDHYTWLLSEIVSPDGIDHISIEYTIDGELCLGDDIQNYSDNFNIFGTDERFYANSVIELVQIGAIITKNERIVFHTSPQTRIGNMPYRDFQDPKNLFSENPTSFVKHINLSLDSISIFDIKDRLIKMFKFDYLCPGSTKFFLSEINEFGADEGALPGYKFSYYETSNIPSLYSVSWDFWGYYNNNTNNLDLTDYAARYPSGNKAHTGMLKKVEYPMGAFTEYEYEPNTYFFPADSSDHWYDSDWDMVISKLIQDNKITETKDNLTGPGVRVKKIISSDGISENRLTTEFDYNNEIGSSGRLSLAPVYAYDCIFVNTNNVPPTIDKEVIKISNTLAIEPGYVTYGNVTVYNGGRMENTTKGKNGKKVHVFQTKPPVSMAASELERLKPGALAFPYPVKLFDRELNGLLLETHLFDKEDKPLVSELMEYESITNPSVHAYGLKSALYQVQHNSEGTLDFLYTSMFYKLQQQRILPLKTTSRTYLKGDIKNYIETSVEYSFARGSKTLLMPTEISTTESNGDVLVSKLYYPGDDEFKAQEPYKTMLKRNMVSPAIKSEQFKNGIQLSGSKTKLKRVFSSAGDTLIVPEESQQWIDGLYETQLTYDAYDLQTGNLLQSHGRDNIINSTVYAYGGTIPVASITMLDYASIGTLADLDALRVSYDNGEIESKLNALRIALNETYPQAFITCSTYIPLVGKLKTTDTNGRSVSYQYDEFGRLISVKDQNGVIKQYNSYNLRK